MSIDGLDFRLCNTVAKENTMDATLALSDHLGGLVLIKEQKLAEEEQKRCCWEKLLKKLIK